MRLALRLIAQNDFASLMLIETLSVWFLRHCSETQTIWETLNPKYAPIGYSKTQAITIWETLNPKVRTNCVGSSCVLKWEVTVLTIDQGERCLMSYSKLPINPSRRLYMKLAN